METTFGRTVETRHIKYDKSMTDLINLRNDMYKNQLSNPFSNNESNLKYYPRKASNVTLNYIEDDSRNRSSKNPRELLMNTIEKNYELNQKLKNKFSKQFNTFTLPRKIPDSNIDNFKNNNIYAYKQSASTLLPRKKYNLGGYSSDSECCNEQLNSLTMNRYHKPRHHNHLNDQKSALLETNLRNEYEFERLQQMNNRLSRYKSIERQHYNKIPDFYNHQVNRPAPRSLMSTPQFNRKCYQTPANYNSNVLSKKFVFNNEPEQSQRNLSVINHEEDLIKNINDYFLKWKNFNYDPMETSDSNLNISNDNHSNVISAKPEIKDSNIKTPMNTSTLDYSTRVETKNPGHDESKVSLTLPRRSKFESPNDDLNLLLNSPKLVFRNRSIEPESLENYSEQMEPKNHCAEFNRLTNLSSETDEVKKPAHLNLQNANCPEVEEIIPLENALLNMNEILRSLAETAEKKKTEYDIMQSVINDFEALKELSPLSTSTSISIPPSSETNHQNINNLSPSSSSSSSSYTESSKTSNSVISSYISADSSKSASSDSSAFFNSDIEPENIRGQSIHNSRREDNKNVSISKKLKRFLSLNSSKRNEMNKEDKKSKKASK